MITRLKTRGKGILIPTENYSNTIYENKYVNVIGGSVALEDGRVPEMRPYSKVLKNFCSVCGGSADYKAIWQDKQPKLQWFCARHAKAYGPTGLGFKLKVVK